MPEPIPLFPRKWRWPSVAMNVAAVAILIAVVLIAGGQSDHEYPEWAEVTTALESNDWPLVRAARYDPANHFILVDLHSGVAQEVAIRLACDGIRPLVDRIDSGAGFALYEPPDRLMVHRSSCE